MNGSGGMVFDVLLDVRVRFSGELIFWSERAKAGMSWGRIMHVSCRISECMCNILDIGSLQMIPT